MTALAALLFAISLLCGIAAFGLRFRVFRRFERHSAVGDLLRDAHVATYGDLLFLRLFLRRRLVNQADRRLINVYFFVQLAAVVSMLLLLPLVIWRPGDLPPAA